MFVLGLGFTLARAMAVLAPILLASLVSIETYGRIELAHSVGSLLAVAVIVGLPASVPLVLLRSEVPQRFDTLLLLCTAVALVAMGISLALLVLQGQASSTAFLATTMAAAMILQQLWSAILKSRGRPTASVFQELGLWLVILLAVYLAGSAASDTQSIGIYLQIYVAILIALSVREYLSVRRPFEGADLLSNLRLGAPLMATTLVSMLIVSAGRIVLGISADIATVGAYALLFRVTAIAIAGHQLIVIGAFRKLFEWDDVKLKAFCPVIPIFITVIIVIFWLLVDRLGYLLGQRFLEVFTANRAEGLIMLCQTLIWSGITLNEFIVTRYRIAGYVLIRLAPCVLLGLAILTAGTALAPESAVLSVFVVGYAVAMASFFVIQSALIWRCGHGFARLWATVSVLYLVTLGLTLGTL